MKYKCLLFVIIFAIFAFSLPAAEGDPQYSEFVISLLNNEFMLENIRLIALAEGCYDEGKFDDAAKYAREAIQFSQLSDEFIALQLLIKETDETIAIAKNRLDWADRVGAARQYPAELEEAKTAYTDALDFRSKENWDMALEAAKRVINLLSILPESPVLAAQYLVRSWAQLRDCLWNIAAKPEIYGDPTLWRHIYNANRSKLRQPDNPDLIHPGTILDIPSIRGETRQGILE